MTRIAGTLAATILLFSSTLGWAESDTVPVLIPVFLAGPGAFGSHWNTRLTIANTSDVPLGSIPYTYQCGIPEGCLSPFPSHASVVWNATSTFFVTGFFINMGQLELPRVVFSLRVFDDSQSAIDRGTEIPVVPYSSFRESEIQLLDVPTDSRFRVALRVYALATQTPAIAVRTYRDPPPGGGGPQGPRVLISERIVFLQTGTSGPLARPSSVMISDPLGGGASEADGSRFRIGVQSQTPGVPIWAFATVTNNETQRVTVISPQPQ